MSPWLEPLAASKSSRSGHNRYKSWALLGKDLGQELGQDLGKVLLFGTEHLDGSVMFRESALDGSSDLNQQQLHLSRHSACSILPFCKMMQDGKCTLLFLDVSNASIRCAQLDVCHFIFSWRGVFKARLVQGVFSARDYENNENDGQRLRFENRGFHSP